MLFELMVDVVVVFVNVLLVVCVVIDVCVLDCYCGENEMIDWVGGYIFGVCNCFFKDNLVVDGCFKIGYELCEVFVIVLVGIELNCVIL